MFIELLDILRCVRPHDDSWLVGSFDELVDRHVIRGTLGCPVCSAEYRIQNGVADFRSGDATALDGTGNVSNQKPDDESDAMRLAAMLGLGEPGGVVVLMGQWAGDAPGLEALIPGSQFLLVNPRSPVFPFASAVWTDAVLPIATGSIRGVAFDSSGTTDMTARQAVRVMSAGARLVAPVNEAVPDGVDELARDESQWVAERRAEATGPMLRLTRRK